MGINFLSTYADISDLSFAWGEPTVCGFRTCLDCLTKPCNVIQVHMTGVFFRQNLSQMTLPGVS